MLSQMTMKFADLVVMVLKYSRLEFPIKTNCR